jgi:hypothetical protein
MNGVLAQQNKARASESVGDGTLYLSTPSTPSTLSTSTQKHLPAAGRIQHRLTPHHTAFSGQPRVLSGQERGCMQTEHRLTCSARRSHLCTGPGWVVVWRCEVAVAMVVVAVVEAKTGTPGG